MEQYRNNTTGDEKRSATSEDQDCFDGQRCSGYGQCCPSRGRPERKGKCDGSKVVATSTNCMLKKMQNERVSLISDENNILNNNSLSGSCFPQITLLKPKGKSLPNVFRGSSCKDGNQQPAMASRSLSALTDRPSKESKNICKGASGDKIDTNGEQIK